MRLLPAVLHRLRAAGRPVSVIEAAASGATADRVRSTVDAGAGAVGGVVALGGDGLAHLLLDAVAGSGIPLGLVPAGGGNDLAAGLGLPLDPRAATDVVVAGRTREVDLGLVVAPDAGRRWWGSILCAGFDSAVNERANALRWPTGPRRYDVAVLIELARLRPHQVRLRLGDRVLETDVILVAVCNTARYGGGLLMCPSARPDDGYFDVTVVTPVRRGELLRMLPQVRTGAHLAHPAVRVHRVTSVGIEPCGASPATAYADGERIGALPVETRCERGALTVFVP